MINHARATGIALSSISGERTRVLREKAEGEAQMNDLCGNLLRNA